MSQHVVTEVLDRVGRIELARPEKKNAITGEMYLAMVDALDRMDADPGARAVLLHGAPECFCAGNDLNDFLAHGPLDEDFPALKFLRRIATVRKPIVAAVTGAAVGIGTTMLLHCDLVYAATGTRFHLPFAALGLVPEGASSLLLPMIAGHQRAAELLLLAQPFDAVKAVAAGIVNAIVPEADLLKVARTAALQLAALPPAAVRLTKELMKRPHAQAVAAQMSEEARLFGERVTSPEATEAMTAFFEKRKPDFSRFS